MPRAGVGIAENPDPVLAAGQAASAALQGCPRPDAALVFASPGETHQLPALLDAACATLGTRAIAGATAHGVVGAGQEVEGAGGVAVVALEGIEAHPFLVPDLAAQAQHVGDEVVARIGEPREEDLVVVLPDPRALQPEVLLTGLREVLGPARLVGAGAADPVADHPLQWCGDEIEGGALAGMVLRGAAPPRIGVTQACRPVTDLLTITRAEGHWILELDGRPALEVFRQAAGGRLADDLRRAAAFVFVALPLDAEAPLDPGGYLVRNVAGFAPPEGAFAVAAPVAKGERIALVHREPETAREDLKDMLSRLAPTAEAPLLGLWFDCCARGAAFFGVPGLEAAYLQSAVGDLPVGGMFGSCEIGPVAGRPELLTYTGVLALVEG